MPIEIIEERASQGDRRFRPKADQTQYASIWASVDGNAPGYFTCHEVNEGIPSADGKMRLKGKPWADDKGKHHEIHVGPAKLREMIVSKEDQKTWTQYEAAQANNRTDAFLKAERERRAVPNMGGATVPELTVQDREIS